MKCVVISDTHNNHEQLELPEADTIIHCGDFSNNTKQVFKFVKWYGNLPYKNKILVAGNHDTYVESIGYNEFYTYCKSKGIIYLEDTSCIIDGIKFHGSPMSPRFFDWSFMNEDNNLQKHWDKIDDDVDVLITHSPAYGIGDTIFDSYGFTDHVGSYTLHRKIIELPKLKYHLCGHIHESYGEYKTSKEYKAINASSYNHYTKNLNKPIVFKINKDSV